MRHQNPFAIQSAILRGCRWGLLALAGYIALAAAMGCGTPASDLELPVDTDACTDPAVWYADGDGDGHGDFDATAEACEQPEGYVAFPSDCDDGDAMVNPDELEACGDGVDNNCDGATDDTGEGAGTWVFDGDGDGYGDGDRVEACDAPVAYVAAGGDCDDDDHLVHPDATEICDGVDNDCDGGVDEDLIGTTAQCAADVCADVGDGVQWLGGAQPYQATCDDGWMLVDLAFAAPRTTFEGYYDDGYATTQFNASANVSGIVLESAYYPTAGSVPVAVRAVVELPLDFTETRGSVSVDGGGYAYDNESGAQWGVTDARWTNGAGKADGHLLVGAASHTLKNSAQWGAGYRSKSWSWGTTQCANANTLQIEHSDEAGRGVVVTDLEIWVR